MIDQHEYVTFGKVFKMNLQSKDKLTVYLSFGGLLMSITGFPKDLKKLEMDQRVCVLIKKI